MTHITHASVPVKHHGEVIGTAKIDEDGAVQLALYPRNELAKDLIRSINQGLCDGVSISPTIIPARPSTLQDDRRIRDVVDDFFGFTK
jgi:phage head maturation protease